MRVDNALSQERHIRPTFLREAYFVPLLFSVYVNDVPNLPGVEMSIFADNTVAYAINSNAKYAAARFQRQLNAYVDLAEKWKVFINASKSTVVVFSKSWKLPDRLRVDGTRIPWGNSVKYLGLHIDRRIIWRTHVSYVADRIKQRVWSLEPILHSSNITRRPRKLPVTTYVVPLVTYAMPVWGYMAKTHRQKLQGLLDRGLRRATKAHYLTSNHRIRTPLEVRPLTKTICRLSRKFHRRAARFEGNAFISASVNTDQRQLTPGPAPKESSI